MTSYQKNPPTSYLTFGRFFNTFINFSPFELITNKIYYETQTFTPPFLEDILTEIHRLMRFLLPLHDYELLIKDGS